MSQSNNQEAIIEVNDTGSNNGASNIPQNQVPPPPPPPGTKFSVSRIKSIMKSDPELSLTSKESVFLVSKATELFVDFISKESYKFTSEASRKTIQKKDIEQAVATVDALYFLEVFVQCLTQSEIDHHLEMGKRMLAAGQLADALTHYHSAIDGDPNNYSTYYRRATVYLGMGKAKAALQDLNKVVELKPDFHSARLQRANVLLKQGEFQSAKEDYQLVLQNEPDNYEAIRKIESIMTCIDDITRARQSMQNNDYQPAIDLFNRVLEVSPWSTEVHEFRSECYLQIGDIQKAISDIHALSKLIPDNTDAYYKLSELHYVLGDADSALSNIRDCLKLDPDHKKCSDFYKKLKKLAKFFENMKKAHDEQNYGECVNMANKIIDLDKQAHNFKIKCESYICMCNSKAKNSKDAIETCSEILKRNPHDVEALYHRAQVYLLEERYDEAVADCQKAQEHDDSQRNQECVQRAQKLLKQSKKRDYYKILGVKRSANKQDILRAYRKMANQWHPDKFTTESKEAQEAAQKKFIDIAAAKEVLTDPEKRQKFDNGEDPLDAEEQAQQGHGFNPFGHGFNPFGGGPFGGGNFQFKFKFN